MNEPSPSHEPIDPGVTVPPPKTRKVKSDVQKEPKQVIKRGLRKKRGAAGSRARAKRRGAGGATVRQKLRQKHTHDA